MEAAEVAELFSDLSSELFSDLSSELFSPDEVAEAVKAAGQEGEAGQALSLPGLAGQSSSRSLKLQRVSEAHQLPLCHRSTEYSVQITEYRVISTEYSLQFTEFILQSTVYRVHCAEYT